MALNYVYSDAPLSTIDITDRCREYVLSVTDRAEEGSVAISNLVIDDPDGDLTITGHRRMYIFEDTAPAGDQMVFNGFVVNERIIRGPSGRTGASRQWVVDLADPNVFINRRIMNGPDANRPAETDLERIQALLTMTELNTVDDDSLVNTTATTVAMDAVDYRGQNVGNYIDDCRQQSGKNAYIYYNETLGEYGLWYDFDYSTAYDSGKYLSNVLADIDQETVFQYSQERTYLNVDPSRVASGIYLEYAAGLVYAQDSDTTDEFAAIDWAAPSLNVKTEAKALARANRYLTDAATEDYVVHVVMTAVPREHVNAIKKGQLVRFKSSYMAPWFDEYSTFRVLFRTVSEIAEDPTASFEIEMDLTPVDIPSLQHYTFTQNGGCNNSTWPLQPTEDNTLIHILVQRANATEDPTIVPIGNTAAEGLCENPDDIPGTDYTFVTSVDVNVDQYVMMMATRVAVASEPRTVRWGGLVGLSGSAGPRAYGIEISGLAGTVEWATTSEAFSGGDPGTVFTSHAPSACSGPGYLVWVLQRSAPGPADGFSASYVYTADAPAVLLDQGYASGGFSPNSCDGYVRVDAAGTPAAIVVNCSATPRDPGDPWSWILAFLPDA